MARFSYSLQPVLTVAQARELEARTAAARARAALDAELFALRALELRVRDVRGMVQPTNVGALVGAELLDVEHCIAALGATRRKTLSAIVLARSAVATTTSAHASAARRKTALERHRERHHRMFLADRERRAGVELDESNAQATRRASFVPESIRA